MRLIVATFNVHHCEGRDGRLDVERVADAMTASTAEVVALQELDRGLPRSGGVDQPALLEHITELHFSFYPTVRIGGGEYGIALAAREPLETSLRPLPRGGREEPRVAIEARYKGLFMVATHLATQRRPRALQADAVAAAAGRAPGPVVVLGDLNQTGRELRRLRERGLVPGPGRAVTHLGRRHRRIDHVLGGRGARVLETWTVPSEASDHLPLVAEVEF